jgi:hypothetical protein
MRSVMHNRDDATQSARSPAAGPRAAVVDDRRPEAVELEQWQKKADHSPQVLRLEALQEMANSSPRVPQFRALREMANGGQLTVAQHRVSDGMSNTARTTDAPAEEVGQRAFNPIADQPVEIAPVPNRTGLPDDLKAGIERLSGLSMDDIRVHYNSDRPAQLRAYAFTRGTDIHVAPGEERHLPHEAWHVVQQQQRRVRSTVHLPNGTPINADQELEQEADVLGNKAMQMKCDFRSVTPKPLPVRNKVVQRCGKEELKGVQRPNRPVKGMDNKSKIDPESLLKTIESARDAIKSTKYQEAFELLTSEEGAKQLGISLKWKDVPIEISDPLTKDNAKNLITSIAKINRYYPKEARIELANVRIWNTTTNEEPKLFEVELLAKAILPMYLEEYIHAYQECRKSFLSKSIHGYIEQKGKKEEANESAKIWGDQKEVDVLAIFHEWGFDVEDIDYVNRYSERKAFWEWLTKEKEKKN